VIDRCPSGVVIRDGFPISPGHTLVIPIRQQSHFEIGSEVLQDCVHKFDCGHNAQYLREPKIFDPANPSQIFA